MKDMKEKDQPTVYMLCGFVASGKTSYSRGLEQRGCARLSIDEAVYERHGRHGIDYPESEYPAREAEARVDLDRRLRELIVLGRCVVLDYGFWTKDGRDRYKQLIVEAGGSWRLLYFDVDPTEIRNRLQQRNEEDQANALFIDERMLEEFLSRWQPPKGEGEQVIGRASEASSRGR